MKSARFVSVACLLLVLLGSLQTVSAGRYCGDLLPKTLAFLCAEYFSLDDIKKNTVGYYEPLADLSGENFREMEMKRDFNGMVPYASEQMAGDEWIGQWFKRKPSHRFIVPHMQARFRRAVANECCQQDCNLDQLLSYCKVVAPGVLSS
uniref:Insulin-like domain-containing protein n=1 Tax=Anopheles farauti TaxID=69004 RepID=A0A182QHQ9_9DIPT